MAKVKFISGKYNGNSVFYIKKPNSIPFRFKQGKDEINETTQEVYEKLIEMDYTLPKIDEPKIEIQKENLNGGETKEGTPKEKPKK